jgi:hypothetical protein
MTNSSDEYSLYVVNNFQVCIDLVDKISKMKYVSKIIQYKDVEEEFRAGRLDTKMIVRAPTLKIVNKSIGFIKTADKPSLILSVLTDIDNHLQEMYKTAGNFGNSASTISQSLFGYISTGHRAMLRDLREDKKNYAWQNKKNFSEKVGKGDVNTDFRQQEQMYNQTRQQFEKTLFPDRKFN